MDISAGIEADTVDEVFAWANSERLTGRIRIEAAEHGHIQFTNGFVSLVTVDGDRDPIAPDATMHEVQWILASRLARLLVGFDGRARAVDSMEEHTHGPMIFLASNLLSLARKLPAPEAPLDASQLGSAADSALTDGSGKLSLQPQGSRGGIHLSADAWDLVVVMSGEVALAGLTQRLGWDQNRLTAAIDHLRSQGVLTLGAGEPQPAPWHEGPLRVDSLPPRAVDLIARAATISRPGPRPIRTPEQQHYDRQPAAAVASAPTAPAASRPAFSMAPSAVSSRPAAAPTTAPPGPPTAAPQRLRASALRRLIQNLK